MLNITDLMAILGFSGNYIPRYEMFIEMRINFIHMSSFDAKNRCYS